MVEISQDDLREYRKNNFACKVKPARHSIELKEYTLSVTHNGAQWSSISLTPREIEIVIEMLNKSC